MSTLPSTPVDPSMSATPSMPADAVMPAGPSMPTESLMSTDALMTHSHFSLTSFLATTDLVARIVLVILAVMSIVTWTVIVARCYTAWVMSRRNKRFLYRFWHAPSLKAAQEVSQGGADAQGAFANVARHGFAALAGVESGRPVSMTPGSEPLNEAGQALLRRMLERGIAQGRRAGEFGLGALASVASSAPYIGLFGTVWGVYQALSRISATGQGTLDKVAGPIGEALIMTGIGLAVAIPAVIGYNAFARRSRHLSADLATFAGDLMALFDSGWKAPQLLAGDLDAAAASAHTSKPRSALPGSTSSANGARPAGGPIGGAALGTPQEKL